MIRWLAISLAIWCAPVMAASVPDTMRIAVPLVAKWEGKRNEAYRDIVGVWTICYGHTHDVKAGDYYTDAQCRAMLREELEAYHLRLLPAFTAAAILPPARHAAFDSLAYNVGVSGVSRSTAVRRLNAGNIEGACQAIGWWNRAGGRVVRGLVNRRTEEVELCMHGLR